MEKADIKSLTLSQLTEEMEKIGEKAFRAKQIFDWLHVKHVTSFEEMTNLSKKLIQTLGEQYELTRTYARKVQISKLDGTRKYLLELPDGNLIESVFMRYKHGNCVCISSQVGCRMGCRFCASTIDGLWRSLKPSEMLEQVYRIWQDTGERISHVVVMGSGEPMDNYDNLIRFIRLITAPEGLNISQRNLTVSTCGIVPGIKRFANEGFSVTLAVSLHASNNEKRKKIMPVANRYPLSEVLQACQYYFERTKRRVTFEYSLAEGVNDTNEDAEELILLLKGKNCHINLIPINPVKERDFIQPQKKIIENFKNKLEKSGINVTIRREMGRDIDGACGQLRKSYIEKNR